MPRSFTSLTMSKGKPFWFWYCPKCGVAYPEDCMTVEEGPSVRLKHKCGHFLKPIARFRGYSLRGLEACIAKIRKESKENEK